MLAEVVEQVVLAGLEGGRGEFGDRRTRDAASFQTLEDLGDRFGVFTGDSGLVGLLVGLFCQQACTKPNARSEKYLERPFGFCASCSRVQRSLIIVISTPTSSPDQAWSAVAALVESRRASAMHALSASDSPRCSPTG